MPTIDRLFLKLATTFGKHWIDLWAHIPIQEVKADWSRRLRENNIGLTLALKAIDDMVSAGKTYPPTLPEFIQHCKGARPQHFNKAIVRIYTDEELALNRSRIQSEIAKLKPVNDYRKWARDILADSEKGLVLPDISVRFAKEALNATAE